MSDKPSLHLPSSVEIIGVLPLLPSKAEPQWQHYQPTSLYTDELPVPSPTMSTDLWASYNPRKKAKLMVYLTRYWQMDLPAAGLGTLRPSWLLQQIQEKAFAKQHGELAQSVYSKAKAVFPDVPTHSLHHADYQQKANDRFEPIFLSLLMYYAQKYERLPHELSKEYRVYQKQNAQITNQFYRKTMGFLRRSLLIERTKFLAQQLSKAPLDANQKTLILLHSKHLCGLNLAKQNLNHESIEKIQPNTTRSN